MTSAFLEKLSSYNLLNYLLPGVIFSFIVSNVTSFSLIQGDLLVGAFLYYFIGMIISRLGSLIIEPVYKRLGIVSYSDYSDYVAASNQDKKLEVLLETNNRTFVSLFIAVVVTKLYELLVQNCSFFSSYGDLLLVLLLFLLFSFSYSKQTGYIKSRVDKYKDNS